MTLRAGVGRMDSWSERGGSGSIDVLCASSARRPALPRCQSSATDESAAGSARLRRPAGASRRSGADTTGRTSDHEKAHLRADESYASGRPAGIPLVSQSAAPSLCTPRWPGPSHLEFAVLVRHKHRRHEANTPIFGGSASGSSFLVFCTCAEANREQSDEESGGSGASELQVFRVPG